MLHVVTVIAAGGGLGVGQRVGGDWVGGEAWGTYGKSRGTRPRNVIAQIKVPRTTQFDNSDVPIQDKSH